MFTHDDMIKRAEEIGNNVMKSLNTPVEKRGWLGDPDMGCVQTVTPMLLF